MTLTIELLRKIALTLEQNTVIPEDDRSIGRYRGPMPPLVRWRDVNGHGRKTWWPNGRNPFADGEIGRIESVRFITIRPYRVRKAWFRRMYWQKTEERRPPSDSVIASSDRESQSLNGSQCGCAAKAEI